MVAAPSLVRSDELSRLCGSLDERTTRVRAFRARQLRVRVGSGSDPDEIQLSESPDRLATHHELER